MCGCLQAMRFPAQASLPEEESPGSIYTFETKISASGVNKNGNEAGELSGESGENVLANSKALPLQGLQPQTKSVSTVRRSGVRDFLMKNIAKESRKQRRLDQKRWDHLSENNAQTRHQWLQQLEKDMAAARMKLMLQASGILTHPSGRPHTGYSITSARYLPSALAKPIRVNGKFKLQTTKVAGDESAKKLFQMCHDTNSNLFHTTADTNKYARGRAPEITSSGVPPLREANTENLKINPRTDGSQGRGSARTLDGDKATLPLDSEPTGPTKSAALQEQDHILRQSLRLQENPQLSKLPSDGQGGVATNVSGMTLAVTSASASLSTNSALDLFIDDDLDQDLGDIDTLDRTENAEGKKATDIGSDETPDIAAERSESTNIENIDLQACKVTGESQNFEPQQNASAQAGSVEPEDDDNEVETGELDESANDSSLLNRSDGTMHFEDASAAISAVLDAAEAATHSVPANTESTSSKNEKNQLLFDDDDDHEVNGEMSSLSMFSEYGLNISTLPVDKSADLTTSIDNADGPFTMKDMEDSIMSKVSVRLCRLPPTLLPNLQTLAT